MGEKAKNLWEAYESLDEKEKIKFNAKYRSNLEKEALNRLKKRVDIVKSLFTDVKDEDEKPFFSREFLAEKISKWSDKLEDTASKWWKNDKDK